VITPQQPDEVDEVRGRIESLSVRYEAASRSATGEVDRSWRLYGEIERVQRRLRTRRRGSQTP
jgi:hypothetical protein